MRTVAQLFCPLCLEKKYVITLSFTLMEYIKNGNWIEFNNIMLDTLIFTRRTVVIFSYCAYNFFFVREGSTHFNYILQNNNGTRRQREREEEDNFLHEFELMKGRT